MKVLVTGGCGYIGSHVVKMLQAEEHDVFIYDNLSTGILTEEVSTLKFLYGDLGDFGRLESVFATQSFDVVIHLAASINVNESVYNPAVYYENNTANTARLLRMCDRYHVHKFIYSSTAAVYGSCAKGFSTVDEYWPTQPASPYASSKLMSEKMITDLAAVRPVTAPNSGFNYVILRYFNVAGIGKGHGPHSSSAHLIKTACEVALGKKKCLRIFGTNYNTPDGTCIRDYIHVSDIARAHVDALKHLEAGGAGDVFNVGYGRGLSVREVVTAVKRVTGSNFDVSYDLPREGDPEIVVANNNKIRHLLGWVPKHDNIDEIIKSTLEWESAHG